ncbi:MAG: MATE family efflux transporter [Peptostreptococcaceae bacterium]
MQKDSLFEKKSIQQLIIIFSFPLICSLVLESLTSMVDTAFAGHLGINSSDALAAMGILSPILQLLIATQLIFGVSTSIVISKRLGEKDDDKINSTFKVGFYASVVFSGVISFMIFILKEYLLNILGANGSVRVLANEYLNIAIVFNVFSSVGYMLVNNIRAFGYPKIEIITSVCATLINIVFNVVFTFVFNMGIKGIALSTLLSEVFYFSFATIFLINRKLWFKRHLLKLEESKHILISLVKIGFVQFLAQSLNSVSGFIINKQLLNYASIAYIGGWSICSNINMIILLPLIGLTQGVQSVIAYFIGSEDKTKETIAKKTVTKYSLMYAIIVSILVFIFANNITNIFTNDTNLAELSVNIVRIIVIGFPFLGIIYTMITFMQVSGEEDKASKIELVRQILLLIPLVLILPIIFSRDNIFNIKPQLSIFFAIPISSIVLVLMYSKYLRKHINKK